jgi:hypothetical protein
MSRDVLNLPLAIRPPLQFLLEGMASSEPGAIEVNELPGGK